MRITKDQHQGSPSNYPEEGGDREALLGVGWTWTVPTRADIPGVIPSRTPQGGSQGFHVKLPREPTYQSYKRSKGAPESI